MNVTLGNSTIIPLSEFKFTEDKNDSSYIPKINDVEEDILYTISKDNKWITTNNYVNLIGRWNDKKFSYIMTLMVIDEKLIYVDLKKRGQFGDFLIIYDEFEYDVEYEIDQEKIQNEIYKSFHLKK